MEKHMEHDLKTAMKYVDADTVDTFTVNSRP